MPGRPRHSAGLDERLRRQTDVFLPRAADDVMQMLRDSHRMMTAVHPYRGSIARSSGASVGESICPEATADQSRESNSDQIFLFCCHSLRRLLTLLEAPRAGWHLRDQVGLVKIAGTGARPSDQTPDERSGTMATCTMYGSGNHAALSANPCVAAAKAAPIARWRELAAADLRRAANAFGESALPSTTSVLIHARGGRTG